MRTIITTMFVTAALIAAAPAQAQDAKADEVLRATREALGGADKIGSIRTIVATGKHRRTMGEVQASGETEISVSLPDKYLRSQTDQMFGNTVTMEMGFNGDQLLQHTNSHGGGNTVIRINAAGGGPGGGPMDAEAMKAAMLRSQRADFARMMLGLIATAPEYLDASFKYAGEAESPDGRADVIEITGADKFAAKLFIDQQTHRPLMLTYMGALPQMVVRRAEGPRRDRSSEPRAEQLVRDIQRDPPPLVEIQVYFDDYRNVGGVWLAHRISRAANGETNEELEFDKIRVNDEIKASTFDAR